MRADFKTIASEIREASKDYYVIDGRFVCSTSFGMRVSCLANPEAIENLARRFEKGLPARLQNKDPDYGHQPVREPRAFDTVFREFVGEGEIANAVAWADLHKKPVVFLAGFSSDLTVPVMLSHVTPFEDDNRFVVGRLVTDRRGYVSPELSRSIKASWRVTHKASGMKIGEPSTSKAAAIKSAREAIAKKGAETLKRAIELAPQDFQQRARAAFTDQPETQELRHVA